MNCTINHFGELEIRNVSIDKSLALAFWMHWQRAADARQAGARTGHQDAGVSALESDAAATDRNDRWRYSPTKSIVVVGVAAAALFAQIRCWSLFGHPAGFARATWSSTAVSMMFEGADALSLPRAFL